MPTTSERILRGLVDTCSKVAMSAPIRRENSPHLVLEVGAITDVAPAVRRITLSGPALNGFSPVAPDEFAGFFLPRGESLSLPPSDVFDIRKAVREMPEQTRPELRWYTIRAYRPEVLELDLEVLLYGEPHGPGRTWAATVQVGDQVGVRLSGGGYRPPRPDEPQILIADESSLPALCAIGESLTGLPEAESVQAYVEIPDDDYAAPMPTMPFPVEIHRRGIRVPGAAIEPVLATTPLSGFRSAWICGEGTMVRKTRRMLRNAGMDRRHIFYCGYWTRGHARP
ncbi:NADPH-dependent ferric siderophore reductase, contains FAD-binding and SIP domains [Austwickia chelonae]|uniref:Putative siderophore-interacting protein n=1 Tax=Austwickia chelonae NBRC 105200 TaxID=1184607 RepID=K6UN37_9MICO|nr:siderophore-interacting protein [Austwickia chelonae]GAB78656.1 putative siderophore-interacting protein [Austwickia chelonae NBRC 105200]SEW34438.1 NADPH-dependent ferric siderophore reductase, contains FAD-binding and SIP domains [Austwickia chelonae]